jgi:hypothetical protein
VRRLSPPSIYSTGFTGHPDEFFVIPGTVNRISMVILTAVANLLGILADHPIKPALLPVDEL